MRCRKRGDGVHGHQPGAVIVSQLPARQGVEIAIRTEALRMKKAEQAIGLQNRPIVPGKPDIIDRDIHGNAPGVPLKGEIIANTNRALGNFISALSCLRGFAATIPLVWREIAAPTSPSHAVAEIFSLVCHIRSLWNRQLCSIGSNRAALIQNQSAGAIALTAHDDRIAGAHARACGCDGCWQVSPDCPACPSGATQ